MSPKERFNKIDKVLSDVGFYLWDINDKTNSVSYFSAKGSYLDISTLKEIIKHAESLNISVSEDRLYVWIKVKRSGYLSRFITYKYYCELHDRYFTDSFDLKLHMSLNEGCRIKVIG